MKKHIFLLTAISCCLIHTTPPMLLAGIEAHETGNITGVYKAPMPSISTLIFENTEEIISTLDRVDNNVAFLVQELNDTAPHDVFSKLDALSSDIDLCCTELNENDATIFSMLERIDTKLIVGVNSIHEKLNARRNNTAPQNNQKKLQHTTITQQYVDTVRTIVITESGYYTLAESITMPQGSYISINTDNVVFDLNGHTLMTLEHDFCLISVEHAHNISIKNGTVIGGQGMCVHATDGISIRDIQVVGSMRSGITCKDTHNFMIATCVVRRSAQHGIVIDGASSNGVFAKTSISDCLESGCIVQATRVRIEDIVAQHNGGNGIFIHGGHDIQVYKVSTEANTMNGILVDAQSERVHVESCRALGNGSVGCSDEGATQVMWMNNLSSGNTVDDYNNIRAVALTKATSYWHNVYGS